MPTSDAILVGEDWISEHYVSTDATSQSFHARVLARRKEWDAAETPTARSRFTAARADLEAALADLVPLNDTNGAGTARTADDDDAARRVYERLREVLGYASDGYASDGYALHRTGPVLGVSAPGITAGAPLVLVEAAPVETVDDLLKKDEPTLLEPVEVDEKTTLTSVPRLLSALFVDDDAPKFALVMAGRWLLVAEKERWAEGRYLAVNLQLVCERNEAKRGGEVDRALTCVGADSLAPDADGDIWWTATLEDSIKHTVGVSQDLREGVRLSIEIIANEIVTRRREKGLPPLPLEQAQPLAKQSLRFLYRILFLLYAEASPELGVLPVGATEYEQGYSLDRLRDLTLVELTSPHARTGTHLYESLAVLFRLVDRGHTPAQDEPQAGKSGQNDQGDDGAPGSPEGLTFQALRADLFLPAATAHIDEVGLGNVALQQVLRHLLLSKESGGKDRGFISYAELGINQLGAVYEGLMSYTGFFAETDLYEVAKHGDPAKGSWVVPVERADGIAEDDFVRLLDPVTGEKKAVLHERGTFVFRLAGRERQQSASYYTPEVLTRFTVSQALEELLDQDGTATPAADILTMTVCEPALGSGAFAIEAVRQLAAQYLTRRQKETGEKIDPDAYPRELQQVKAYLALHNVYGVDLNATAVELAEVSLWLDTMVSGLQAPWFGLHLRRGNSLIGARRATYSRAQVNDKSWLTATPTDHPLTEFAEATTTGASTATSGRIHHFLLPATGWGAAVEAKEATSLAPDTTKLLKTWRSSMRARPTAKQVTELVDLSQRVETLWQLALRRLQIAEAQARRGIPIWGREPEPAGGAVTREQIEASLADPNGAYQRLRRVMDAWTALWFWPLTEAGGVRPPTLQQWIDACRALVGRHMETSRKSPKGMAQLGSHLDWASLGDAEKFDLSFAGAEKVATVLDTHRWLKVCEQVADRQGFFHWELDLATAFTRGGFDLQVGNPPWVRPRSDVDALLAEGDPWWQLAVKPSEAERAAKRSATLGLAGLRDFVLDGTAEVAVTAAYANDAVNYPYLSGLQPDLYRCFISQTWHHVSSIGTVGLVHPETHFTDEKAGLLRAATYPRLRRHWQFINELKLFEIHNLVQYGVHVYAEPSEHVHFLTAASLYHPDTAERSLHHDGTGEEPGLKDPDGNWDQRPHRNRIITVDNDVLTTWHAVLESEDVPILRTRMLYTVNRAAARVLAVLSAAERVGSLGLEFSRGWDESIDRKKGRFVTRWGVPDSWDEVILQGPHLFVSTPLYKTPRQSMKSNKDWAETDFEALAPDAIPATSYKPAGDRYEYDCAYTDWGDEDDPKPARDYYRIAWRAMAANTGERTLIPAIIPPGASHINGVFCVGDPERSLSEIVIVQAGVSSLLADLLVRAAPKSGIYEAVFARLPKPSVGDRLAGEVALRTLRLNCLTGAYADLWRSAFGSVAPTYEWSGGLARSNRPALADVGSHWTATTPLRLAEDRRQAQLEVDALVALALGVTADELCTVYRTQFAVLYGYDRTRYAYDANGRLVPNEVLTAHRRRGDRITLAERTATNQAGNTYTYELPFRILDREADMRQAYAHFERILAERTAAGSA